MGAAILLIIMCHSTLYIEHAAISRMYTLIKQFSKIGVDLFFFVSGLGLYFSFSRDSDLLRFYRKRLLRIVPQYTIVIACWGIIAVGLSLETVREFIWKYSLISFYLSGELAAWFVAAIILLYVVFPLFYGLLRKGSAYLIELCILIYGLTFCITFHFAPATPLCYVNEAFFVRVPTFLAGVVIGEQSKNVHSDGISHPCGGIYAASGVGGILWLVNANAEVFCGRWIERVVFMPTTVCIAIVLGSCLDKCCARIRQMLVFFGSITLEIYLIHEKVLLICDTYIPRSIAGSILSNAVAVTITILLSYCLGKCVDRLMRKYRTGQDGNKR